MNHKLIINTIGYHSFAKDVFNCLVHYSLRFECYLIFNYCVWSRENVKKKLKN